MQNFALCDYILRDFLDCQHLICSVISCKGEFTLTIGLYINKGKSREIILAERKTCAVYIAGHQCVFQEMSVHIISCLAQKSSFSA